VRPPPQLTVAEWADCHRLLGSRASAEPGPWRTGRTPYLKDVMDALSAVHPAQRVVFMKGAQVGATEIGNNWLGYIMHHVPAPVLAVHGQLLQRSYVTLVSTTRSPLVRLSPPR